MATMPKKLRKKLTLDALVKRLAARDVKLTCLELLRDTDSARKEIKAIETDNEEIRNDLAESRDETADLQFELNKYTNKNHERHVRAKAYAHQCPACMLTMEKENAELRSRVAELEETQSPAGLVTIGECIALLKPLDVIGEPNYLVDLIARAMRTISELEGKLGDVKYAVGEVVESGGGEVLGYTLASLSRAETAEAKAEANNTAVKAWEEVASSPGAVVLLREELIDSNENESRAIKLADDNQRDAETAEAELKTIHDAIAGRFHSDTNTKTEDAVTMIQEYIAAEDHLPEDFDGEDYSLSGAVGRAVRGMETATAKATRMREALGTNDPWPIDSVLREFDNAASLLWLRGYHGHGWELIKHAQEAAKKIRAALDSEGSD